MKKTILFGLLSFIVVPVIAQKQWTLRECIDYAIKHNIEIQQQEIKRKNAEISLNTTKNSRLPNLNASAGETFNWGINEKRTPTSDGYVTSYENISSSSSSFSISSTTPIFDGFKTTNQIKSNELNLLSATSGLAKAKDNLSLNIASYFLQILFKKEILRVYQEQEKLSAQQLQKTQDLVDAGKVAQSQAYDMKSKLASDHLNVVNAENDLNLSLLNLSQQLNLSDPAGFNVLTPDVDGIVSGSLSSMQTPQDVYNTAVASKAIVKESEYNLKSSEKSLKVAQSAYWPTLSLGLGLGTSYLSTYGESFNKQLKNNRAEYVALNLNIPIFNRWATRNSVRAARLDIQNNQLALESVKQSLYKDIQTAYYNAVAAKTKYDATEKALSAAQIAFSYMRDKYGVGKATVFEYNESQTKLISSQSDLLQAKYDYIFRTKILDFYNGREIVL